MVAAGEPMKKKPKRNQLNPNWVQLQQKLKLNSSKSSRTSKEEDTPKSILGKRKDRPDDESNDPQIDPLIPVNDDSSLTDSVAIDCEMVGVGQGNKSALGRVTMIPSSIFCHMIYCIVCCSLNKPNMRLPIPKKYFLDFRKQIKVVYSWGDVIKKN